MVLLRLTEDGMNKFENFSSNDLTFFLEELRKELIKSISLWIMILELMLIIIITLRNNF